MTRAYEPSDQRFDEDLRQPRRVKAAVVVYLERGKKGTITVGSVPGVLTSCSQV